MVDSKRHSAAITEYENIKTLGSGAYGIVSLSRNKLTEEIVAIKQVDKQDLIRQNK